MQEIATNLSNCVYHLQSASDAFTKAIDSILATIDSCAAASNNGDTKLGNASVMFSELSRIRGLDINISKLSDFGHFLSNDVVSVLEDTARLASSSSSSLSTDDHGRLLQAATISSILSNLFRLLTEFSRKYPAKEIEKDILNLRQAKPFLIQFCSESFGEFHRLLVSQDDGGSIARGSTISASSTSVGRNNNHNRSDLPPLATTSTASLLRTPQNQIAYRQQSQQQQQQNTSNNIDENNDISETASNRSKRSGTTKKKKKKKGTKKHTTASLSQQDDDNDDHDNDKDGAPSGSLTVSNLKTQQDSSAASEPKKNKKNKNQAPTSAASASAIAAPPQLISSEPEFSFVKTFLASSSSNDSGDGNSIKNLFLQFDGRGIDSSLPTATRSKYSSIFSSNYFSPISSLLSSRETFISNESTSISVPSSSASSLAEQKQQMFFLDLVQKSLCDSILDTEIGMELGLGLSLENSQLLPQEDPSSSSFALSSSSSQVQQQQQKKVPGWKFPLSSSSSSLGFGIKEVNLGGGTGSRSSSSQHQHLKNNNNNKWISVFGLFASSTSSTRLSFIRQDVFVRSSGGASIVEVGFEVSLIVPDSNNSGNGSGTIITFKPCVRVSSSSSGNNNDSDSDPVGLAFVRIMKDVFLATSDQLLQSMNDEYGDPSVTNKTNNNNKPSTTKSLLSLDAHSHQERERKSQQQYSDSQAKKKLEEEERLRLEQEQRDQDGGLVHGTTNVIRSVGNSVFGVVKGVVMTPVSVAGKVAGVAANSIKDQQLALFARNFPEVIEEYENKNKNNINSNAVFNIDEIVVDLFNCALKDESISLKQGYLYLLKDRCCFCASVLTAKFSIKWRDISSLEKRRYGIFNNSIELMLLNGNSYFLTSFLDRDAALNRIFEFWTGRVV